MSLTRSATSTDPSLKELYELIDEPISCGYLHVIILSFLLLFLLF